MPRTRRYAAQFDRSALPLPPGRKLAVLACMDARLTVEDVLGLRSGDAHIIRNAGGLATDDAIRSLVISQQLLGTEEVIVIEHTGCGMLTFQDAAVHRAARRADGDRRRPRVPCLPGPRVEPARAGEPDPGPPVDQGRAGARPGLRGRDGAPARGRLTRQAPDTKTRDGERTRRAVLRAYERSARRRRHPPFEYLERGGPPVGRGRFAGSSAIIEAWAQCSASARSSSASTTCPPDGVLDGRARLRAREGDSDDFALLRPRDGVGPNVSLDRVRSTVQVPPRIHLDLYAEDQAAEVRRLIALGATEVHWDKRPPDADYVILADPEGNRFCVIDGG